MQDDEVLLDDDIVSEQDEDLLQINEYTVALETLSNTLNSVIKNGRFEACDVASFESISSGCLLDNHAIVASGGVLSSEAFDISLESGINTEFDLAMFLTSKVFKYVSKAALTLATVTKVFIDDKSIHSFKALFRNSIHNQETMKDIKWSDLNSDQKTKLVKLVQHYSGVHTVGEKETLELLNTVKHSKTSLEVMSKFYLPKHSNILIPLFYIPTSDYNGIVEFFDVNDKSLMSRIDTNLNIAIGQIADIMEKRDWVAMSRFDTTIFSDEQKTPLWKLAKSVRVMVSPDMRFNRVLGKIHGATSMLLDHDKRGKVDAPKFNKDLSHYLIDLDKIKDSILSISDTMMEMNRKAETKSGKLAHDLKKFRASKTIKESFQSGHVTNKYSNANYARIMRELKDLSLYCSFLAKEGDEFLRAYMSVNKRVNHLNNETSHFIQSVNKIVGVNDAKSTNA